MLTCPCRDRQATCGCSRRLHSLRRPQGNCRDIPRLTPPFCCQIGEGQRGQYTTVRHCSARNLPARKILVCKSALDGTGRCPGGAGDPPHPWITAEHTAVMAWVGLSISGPIDGKRGSASNNERTTRQNTPAGCQIGPAGVISVCGKYPHTYTRIQISGKSRTHASKLPAGSAGFRGGGGMAQVMQLSGT